MRRRLCPKEALFTPSFIAVCSANLLFFIASFMMVPVLPIYLLDGLHLSLIHISPLEDGHWLGTDYVGRDIFTGIVYGGRATLAVALAATAFNLVIGLSVGALAGYYQGATNTLLMKITEFFQVLPPLLFAMVIVSLFSPSAGMIAVAIGLVTWPPLARLTRSEFMRSRELE